MADTTISPIDIPNEEPPIEPTIQIGHSGTVNYRGFLQSAEYNRKLLPPQSFGIYDQMAKSDPTVHATLQHIITPILAADWEVRPANDDDISLEHAALIQENMFSWLRRPWVDVQEDALKYLRYGHTVLEGTYRADRQSWHYTRRDGTVVTVAERDVLVWDNWAPRLPTTITRWMTRHDQLIAIEQLAYDPDTTRVDRVVIPRHKCLVLVNEQEGDDYWGVSLLRGAYKPWYILENLQRVAAIGMERFQVGTPMIRMRSNATDTQVTTAMNAAMNIRSGEQTAFVYKADDGVDCDDEANNRAIWILTPDQPPPDALPLMRHFESNIFTNIMARFMDLGQKETGARATAEVQRDPFFLGLVSVATKIADAWNRGPVKQLIDLNYPGVKEYPKIQVSGITPQDIPVIARAAAMWSAEGFLLPDPETERWIREQMGLPAKVTTEEDMAKYALSPPAKARAVGPGGAAHGGHDTGSGVGNLAGGDGQREGGDDSDTPRLADTSAWTPWRSFRPEERFTDWHGASRVIDAARDDFTSRVSQPLAVLADQAIDDAYAAYTSGDVKRVAKLSVNRNLGPLAEAIRAAITAASVAGVDSMRTELNRQAADKPLYDDQSIIAAPGYTLDDPDWLRRAREAGVDPGLIRARAEQIVGILIAKLESALKALTLGFLRRGRFDRIKMMQDLEQQVGAAARLEALMVSSEAFNTGRGAVLRESADHIDRVIYSAILDRNTCRPCAAADGTATDYGSPLFMALDPPLATCSGGNRCRCTWVAVLKR